MAACVALAAKWVADKAGANQRAPRSLQRLRPLHLHRHTAVWTPPRRATAATLPRRRRRRAPRRPWRCVPHLAIRARGIVRVRRARARGTVTPHDSGVRRVVCCAWRCSCAGAPTCAKNSKVWRRVTGLPSLCTVHMRQCSLPAQLCADRSPTPCADPSAARLPAQLPAQLPSVCVRAYVRACVCRARAHADGALPSQACRRRRPRKSPRSPS